MPPSAAPSSFFLPLALAAAAVVALAVSSCSATTDAPVEMEYHPMCEEMVPCTSSRCIQYCVSIGLQQPKGVCNSATGNPICCCVIRRPVPPS